MTRIECSEHLNVTEIDWSSDANNQWLRIRMNLSSYYHEFMVQLWVSNEISHHITIINHWLLLHYLLQALSVAIHDRTRPGRHPTARAATTCNRPLRQRLPRWGRTRACCPPVPEEVGWKINQANQVMGIWVFLGFKLQRITSDYCGGDTVGMNGFIGDYTG